jgi:type IV pilus assembly protein PilW
MKTTHIGARGRKAQRGMTQRGMTLIELMIATAIGLFVLLGVTYAYINNRQSYLLNEALANIQENARVISESLNHDLRMAGSVGCNPDETTIKFGSLSGIDKDKVRNGVEVTTDGAATGRDGGNLRLNIYGALGGGMVSLRSEASTEASGNLIPIQSGASATKLSDTLGGTGYMVISDCERSQVFSGTVGADSITVNGGFGGNDVYGMGAQVFGIAPIPTGGTGKPFKQFYLGDSGRLDVDNVPIISLFYGNTGDPDTDTELAEGVDAFRVCVGEEDSNTIKPATDVSPDGWKKVTMVQVDVVLYSINPRILQEDTPSHFNLCGDAPATPSVTVTPPDRRLRRMFSTSVALRNKLSFVPKAAATPEEVSP